MAAPIEAKVQTGSLAAGLSGVVLWVFQTWVFKGSDVPGGVVSLVYLAVPALLAGITGYLTPHTPRPPVPAQSPEQPAPPAAGAPAEGQPS